MSNCRSCGAPVKWAKTKNDKWMILDAEPRDDGNVALSFNPQYGRHEATVYSSADAAHEAGVPEGERYLDHHVTCPQAKDWRKE